MQKINHKKKGNPHTHRYAFGKQEELISFSKVLELVDKSKLSKSELAYFWLLYYTGVRKSEAYERTAEDFKIKEDQVIIDFHQRKKRGATPKPLKLPLHWPGVSLIVDCVSKAQERKPSTKTIFIYSKKVKTTKKVKARYVFPHIQSTHAWKIVKQVLGPKYYPHFLRLNRLSEIGSEPSANLLRLKSVSGIKSISTLRKYLGVSEKEQDEAFSLMDQKIRDHLKS